MQTKCLAVVICLFAWLPAHLTTAMNLLATDFGLVADGKTDDGPAIRKLLAHADSLGKPTRLIFPSDREIYVGTGSGRYVFLLDNIDGLRIEGQGSTFLLASDLRFLHATDCEDLTVSHVDVDFIDPPTTPGTITKVDVKSKFIEVRLDESAMDTRMGGPTQEDGEQAFFGMALLDASFDTTRVEHFYVDSVQVVSPGVVRITNDKTQWDALHRHVKPEETRIGLPVPGIAHRLGPGALIDIEYCTDVTMSRINVWSAPWFAFRLINNEGLVRFSRVNVQPKPGSGKVLSACRDAIHAKGNRAELQFDSCILSGLGDDAFNLATHGSRIRSIVSSNKINVSQHFPLQHIPFRVGDTLVMLDPTHNRKLGERKIMAVKETASRFGARFAPSSLLTLDQPLGEEIKVGAVVWSRESANPMSTIRRCVIRRSCRLQTPVVIQDCDIQAFLWFYGDDDEGPGPESVVIRNSQLKANGLTPSRSNAFRINGWESSIPHAPSDTDAMLRSVKLHNNRIWGRASIQSAYRVEASGNQFMDASYPQLDVQDCTVLEIKP